MSGPCSTVACLGYPFTAVSNSTSGTSVSLMPLKQIFQSPLPLLFLIPLPFSNYPPFPIISGTFPKNVAMGSG